MLYIIALSKSIFEEKENDQTNIETRNPSLWDVEYFVHSPRTFTIMEIEIILIVLNNIIFFVKQLQG